MSVLRSQGLRYGDDEEEEDGLLQTFRAINFVVVLSVVSVAVGRDLCRYDGVERFAYVHELVLRTWRPNNLAYRRRPLTLHRARIVAACT